MTDPPIIDVTLDLGQINYRTRTSHLDTRAYGQIIASLVHLTAKMFATEGGFDEKDIERDILKHFNQEIEHPTSETTMSQLQ